MESANIYIFFLQVSYSIVNLLFLLLLVSKSFIKRSESESLNTAKHRFQKSHGIRYITQNVVAYSIRTNKSNKINMEIM